MNLLRAGVAILALTVTGLTPPAAGHAQSRLDRLPPSLREQLVERQAEEDRPVDLQAILPGARIRTEAYGLAAAQQMDIYTPPEVRNAPILVMVHGGAWMIGDKANTGSVENKLRHWLPRGWVLVSVNYRLLPDAMALEQAQDVADAMRRVQSRAPGWGGDPDRIVLMGHSAGGHLAALVSARPTMVGRAWASTVILDSAALDVSTTMAQRHPGFYDRAFGTDQAYWSEASPLEQWTPDAAPMMIVCSIRRPDSPCDDARRFQALAAAQGRDVPVLPVDLTHADVNTALGRPGSYTAAIDAFIGASVE